MESFAKEFSKLLKFTIRAESEGKATVAALINFGSSSLSWLRCLTLVFFIVSGLSSKLKAPSMRPPAALIVYILWMLWQSFLYLWNSSERIKRLICFLRTNSNAGDDTIYRKIPNNLENFRNVPCDCDDLIIFIRGNWKNFTLFTKFQFFQNLT